MIKLFNYSYDSMKFIHYKVNKSYPIFSTQRGKNMAKTLKFVYVMILFLSIFYILIVCDSNTFGMDHPCKTDKDCPRRPPHNIKCRKGFCVPIGNPYRTRELVH